MKNENNITKYFIVCTEGDPRRYVIPLGDNQFKYGAQVVFKNEYGVFIGTISSFEFTSLPKKSAMGTFMRYASDSDLKKFKSKQELAMDFRNQIRKKAEDLKLKMNITHALYAFQGKVLVVYYTAEDRVDFRELIVWVREELGKRITMRQINPRQRAEAITHFSSMGEFARRKDFFVDAK